MNEELFNKIAKSLSIVLFLVWVVLSSYSIDPEFAFFVSWMVVLVFILEILMRDLDSKGIKFCLT